MRYLPLFPLLTLACLIASPAHAGVYAPARKWSLSPVRVCWQNPAAYRALIQSEKQNAFDATAAESTAREFSAEKRAIREVIETNFTESDLGLTFIGWRECPSEPSALAQVEFLIILDESDAPLFTGSGTTSIGNSDPENDPYTKILAPGSVRQKIRKQARNSRAPSFIRMTFPTEGALLEVSRMDAVRMIALHEFGHAAGLGHEDDHPENPEILNHPLLRAIGHRLGTEFEAYAHLDPQSVMSYQYTANVFLRVGSEPAFNPQTGALEPVTKRKRSRDIESQIADLFRNTTAPTPARWPDRSVLEPIADTSHFRVVPALSRGDRETLRALYK